MNLQRLGHIISPRLPLELVWHIVTFLPVRDILRLIGDNDHATIDRLLLHHPFFTVDRRLYILLMADPTAFQTYLVPGRPVPQLTYLEPLPSTCCATRQPQQQQHFYSILQPLDLIRKEGRQIEFAPREQGWVRMRGVMGVAVVLVHKNIILKRSLHAVHPARQPRLEREAYFGGSIEFDHQTDLARVTRSKISLDWFCC